MLYRGRLPALREDAGHPLLAEYALRINDRQQLGPLDAVEGLCPFDVQRGHAQVAVVGQRQFNDLPQPLVDEEIPPRDVGGGCPRPDLLLRVCGGARPGGGDGCLRARVRRRQGASPQERSDHDQCKEKGPVHIIDPLMDGYLLSRVFPGFCVSSGVFLSAPRRTDRRRPRQPCGSSGPCR